MMNAIRGAITIEQDTKEEIISAVKELLEAICAKNSLNKDDIISIIFSSTADIHSFYPAKAARISGFNCPFFSAQEPEINGSLPLCIRVMIFTDTTEKPYHVYLKGAKVLRKDITEIINIALDGPAGSGKSTIAKQLANKMSILYLDTGAMYRAFALYCLRLGGKFEDESFVLDALSSLDLEVEYKEGKQITLLNGEDVSETIRQNEISNLASKVSAYPQVRERMVFLQQQIAKKMSCVLDGRDIGTVVLPNCPYKFFMTATAEVRAARRYNENLKKGIGGSYEKILQDIQERDYRDSHRTASPLRQAEDAILIDTSNMSIEQVVDTIFQFIQQKV